MKKLICFAGFGLALVLSSCEKEQINPQMNGETVATVLEATLPGSVTRTVMGAKNGEDKYPVSWSAGDAISVNGVSSSSIEIKSPESTAEFTFASAVSSP